MKQLLFLVLLSAISHSSCAQRIVLNKGIAGNSSNDLLKRIDTDVLAKSPDMVILMVGTNDMVNSKKMVSYSQYKENYQAIVRKLKEQKIKIVLMSPPPVDTGYLFTRHNRKLYTEDPNRKLDSIGMLIKQLSKQEQLHFIDLNSVFKAAGSPNREAGSLIINKLNFGVEDGIHPTKEGYELIAETIYSYLKNNNLLKNTNSIICFGDSITYGSFMTGAGTTEGGTYPALLQKRINK